MLLQRILPAWVGVAFAAGTVAFAQQPQTTAAPQSDSVNSTRLERREGRRRGLGDRKPHMPALNGALSLTEAQRQQQQAIMQRQFAATKAQREELFQLREKGRAGNFSPEDQARAKTLHQEIRDAMTDVRDEMIGILTPEQRSQLETLKQQRKQRNGERLNRRQKALINKPASAPPESQ